VLPVLLGGVAVRGVDVDVSVGEARHEGAPAEVERLDPAGQRPHPTRRDDVHDALAVHHDGRAVDRLLAGAVDQERVGEHRDPRHRGSSSSLFA
jgi:hypothetical protein